MNNKLKIFYLSNERFPATLACTIQQVLMCEAFAKEGASVQLVVPKYHDMPPESTRHVYDYYGVEPVFGIHKLFSLLSLSKPLVDGKKHFTVPFVGGLSLLFSTGLFALKLWLSSRLKRSIFYSRSVNGAYVFLLLRRWLFRHQHYKIYLEVHSLDQQHPQRFFHKLLRECDGLICITEALRQAVMQRYDVPVEKTIVAPDGVRKSQLKSKPMSKSEARAHLNIRARNVVLYTGQLLPGKGADVFVDAATYFSNDVTFFLVGGHGAYWEQMQQRIKNEKINNVILTGFVPPAQVTIYQAAADVLVLPATADHAISAYTSPLKLFEYMASNRPMIASDLPVLQEILTDGKNALLFKERDSADLADKIALMFADAEKATSLAKNALADVQHLTWANRAERILQFIKDGTV